LLVTLITPCAPTAIIGKASGSSPERSAMRPRALTISSCTKKALPEASLIPTTLGQASKMRSSVSTLMSTMERPGIL
jgi:hypothetical protein